MREKKLPQSDIKGAFGRLSTPEMRYGNIFGAWKAAGYPEEPDRISRVLQGLGYTQMQIDRAFGMSMLAHGALSPVGDIDKMIRQLYDYIIEHGLKARVAEYMQDKYKFGSTTASSTSGFGRIKNMFKWLSEDEMVTYPEFDTTSTNAYNSEELLSEEQYNTLLQELDRRLLNRLNSARIKRKVIKAWKRGMHRRTHYDDLLRKVDLSLNDLV